MECSLTTMFEKAAYNLKAKQRLLLALQAL